MKERAYYLKYYFGLHFDVSEIIIFGQILAAVIPFSRVS